MNAISFSRLTGMPISSAASGSSRSDAPRAAGARLVRRSRAHDQDEQNAISAK
jgi:hypothetical protein